MAAKTMNYLSVRIGDQWYGIKVEQVIEVLHLVAFTELSGVRDDVLGLIVVRDEAMPLVDMRRRLGLEAVQLNLDTPIVAIRDANGPVALLVDDADRVEEIEEAQIVTSHETQHFPFIRAIARLPDHLMFLLDTQFISGSALIQANPPNVPESGIGRRSAFQVVAPGDE